LSEDVQQWSHVGIEFRLRRKQAERLVAVEKKR
jgi:hypothetical protein